MPTLKRILLLEAVQARVTETTLATGTPGTDVNVASPQGFLACSL